VLSEGHCQQKAPARFQEAMDCLDRMEVTVAVFGHIAVCDQSNMLERGETDNNVERLGLKGILGDVTLDVVDAGELNRRGADVDPPRLKPQATRFKDNFTFPVAHIQQAAPERMREIVMHKGNLHNALGTDRHDWPPVFAPKRQRMVQIELAGSRRGSYRRWRALHRLICASLAARQQGNQNRRKKTPKRDALSHSYPPELIRPEAQGFYTRNSVSGLLVLLAKVWP
jgi:hypothetical protein